MGRRGFSLMELLVAVVLLLVVAVSLVGASRVASLSVRRATLELWAAQLIQTEVERLQAVPLSELADGAATLDLGASSWTVTDSTTYRRVELVVRTRPLANVTITDTLYVYRPL